MKELKFRPLRADEIECRIGSIKPNGLSLLLYKDARCDMAILDETVGAFNWKREHKRDNANCVVSIYDNEKKEWISKEDTGKESRTEAEKGLASDSFKRACTNWGIGRALYTSPFIWFNANETSGIDNGKCYDNFVVTDIQYEEEGRKITSVTILNEKTGKSKVFSNATKEPKKDTAKETKKKATTKKSAPKKTTTKKKEDTIPNNDAETPAETVLENKPRFISEIQIKALEKLCGELNVNPIGLANQYRVNSFSEIPEEYFATIKDRLEKVLEKRRAEWKDSTEDLGETSEGSSS